MFISMVRDLSHPKCEHQYKVSNDRNRGNIPSRIQEFVALRYKEDGKMKLTDPLFIQNECYDEKVKGRRMHTA